MNLWKLVEITVVSGFSGNSKIWYAVCQVVGDNTNHPLHTMKNSPSLKTATHKTRLISRFAFPLAIALACLSASCSSSLETTLVQVSSSSGPNNGSLADRINRDINSYRASKGRAGLERHRGLDAIAQKHCNYLASRIGNGGLTANSANHDGFDGRVFAARRIHRMSTIGENVVISANHSSGHLVNLLSKSKSHDKNMRDKWTYIGIGVAKTPSGLVISTQEFGTLEPSMYPAGASRFNNGW